MSKKTSSGEFLMTEDGGPETNGWWCLVYGGSGDQVSVDLLHTSAVAGMVVWQVLENRVIEGEILVPNQ